MAPEHCANGAAEYLFYGGILTLVLNLLSLLAGAARQCALRDGEISGMENCGLCFLGLIVGLLGITFLVVLIWVRKKLNFQFYMKVFIASATHLVAGVSRDIQQLAKLDERRCT